MAKKTGSDGAVLRSALSALHGRLRREDGPMPIGPAGLGVLGLLRREGPMSASDLAELAHLQPQSITRALAALEEADLIGRRVDEDDRRRAVLSISPAGEQLLTSTMLKRVRWLNDAIVEHLDDDEKNTLRAAAELMERIAAGTVDRTKPRSDKVVNLVPFTLVENVKRSVEFYERLGFVVDGHGGEGDTWFFASMHGALVRSARIMFARSCDPIEPREQRITFYCWTDDIGALHARLTAAGLNPSPIDRPEHMQDGEFSLTDPDGYELKFGQPQRTGSQRS